MAPTSIEELFATTANQENAQTRIDQSIENIIRHELGRKDTECMLAQIGDFVVRATRTLSTLTDRLVTGEHIDENTSDRIEEMVKVDDFSDLEYLEYMRNKHAALRKINANIRETASMIELVWKASSKTPKKPFQRVLQDPDVQKLPFDPTPVAVSTDSLWDSKGDSPLPVQPLNGKKTPKSKAGLGDIDVKFDIKSPRIEDDIQGAINELIVSLSSRGKGYHVCPLGTECQKNGVSANGELVVFERNSAFRAHLEKHGKQYKCEVLGCKNREGFARKDQLHRHQLETLFHTRAGT